MMKTTLTRNEILFKIIFITFIDYIFLVCHSGAQGRFPKLTHQHHDRVKRMCRMFLTPCLILTIYVSQIVGVCGPAILLFGWLDVHVAIHTHRVLTGVTPKCSGHHLG